MAAGGKAELANVRAYEHGRLEGIRWFLRRLIKGIGFRFLVKLDGVEGVENFPMKGAAIVMINHIAFVDPVLVLACLPRNVVPLAKIEVYRVPIWGIFPRLWEVIAVRRGEVDRAALAKSLKVLEAGEVLLMAPEGTRNPTMQRGKEGIAYLGWRTGAPIVPVAVEGTRGFPTLDLRRWRQPGARVRIGRPFKFKAYDSRPDRILMRKMTDEAMYVLAGMIPEAMRGVYSDLSLATIETLVMS